ncbi:SRPBCC family protein, partial [Pseudonocardia sp. ICBG1122]|nr:SRPBCC family protein [Pseudonocardia pini]
MADATSSSIHIDAPPERVMAVIADFASYPEWTDQITSVEILDAGADGRARQVR